MTSLIVKNEENETVKEMNETLATLHINIETNEETNEEIKEETNKKTNEITTEETTGETTEQVTTATSPTPAATESHITEPGLTFTRDDVAEHSSYEDCYVVINKQVYDVTLFLKEHPGGEDIIMEFAGYDATTAFAENGHSDDAVEMLQGFKIGRLKM